LAGFYCSAPEGTNRNEAISGVVLKYTACSSSEFVSLVCARRHADTGELEHSSIRPRAPGAYVTLRAEMDLLAAISTCPDIAAGGNTEATIALFEVD